MIYKYLVQVDSEKLSIPSTADLVRNSIFTAVSDALFHRSKFPQSEAFSVMQEEAPRIRPGIHNSALAAWSQALTQGDAHKAPDYCPKCGGSWSALCVDLLCSECAYQPGEDD